MSNVTVQEALNEAIEMITILCNGSLDPTGGAYKTVNQCKAALSEIEKCEPVIGLENGQILWSKMPSEYTGSLFTSPQHRDWVELSDYDIENLADRYLERVQPYSEYVASVNDLKQFAEAYYAEQLNTKG